MSQKSTLRFALSVCVFSWLILSASQSANGLQVEFADLVGKRVDMQTTRNYFTDVEVAEVKPGKLDNSVKHFKLTNGKKTVRVVASKIVAMHEDGKNLDVSYDKKNKSLIHDSEKRTERLAFERETNRRLRPEGQRLWKHLTVEEQEVFLKDQAKFVEDAKKKLNIPLRQIETQFFTFVTDLNSVEVDGYIAYLDAMYAELCKAFGLPPEKTSGRENASCLHFEPRKPTLGLKQK